MKTKQVSLKFLFSFLFIFAVVQNGEAQILKKIGKRAEKAAERAIERRVEKETTEKTEEVLDSILEPGKKGKKPTDKDGNPIPQTENPNDTSKNPEDASDSDSREDGSSASEPKSLQVYSKFDFVPGDKLLFFDDFKDDFIGDFPAKWNTNGSGEVVTIGDSPEKWFELKSKSAYLANISDLPENYTIEFDMKVLGVDKKTSSTARLVINLRDDEKFTWYQTGNNGVAATIPLVQYTPGEIKIQNQINKSSTINNSVESDIRNAILNEPHISIAVNESRFRLWVNETKYLDLPKLVPTNVLNYFRIDVKGLEDAKDRLFINNIKISEGGIDLRRKLISEGKISTNGILFDSGSSKIKPISMGIIRQIYQVLAQESGMKLKIVGHTDADGNDDTNLKLSTDRAQAVKNALVSVYNISSDRLITEGKGELEPFADNNSPEGKAQNRRVEFIKQ